MSTVPVDIASRPVFDARPSRPRLLPGGPGADAAMPPVTDAPAPTIEAQLRAGAVGDAAAQLAQLPPGERAATLIALSETDRNALIASLSTAVLADTFGSMPPDEIAELSPLLNVRRMAAILDKTPPRLAADVLRIIDWGDAGQILARMQGRKAIGSLLLYSDESAGGLMATEVVGLHVEWPASYAITVLRNSGLKPEKLEQLFAVNRDGVLLGRLELSELMFAPAGAHVRSVMHRDIVAVGTDTDQEESARIMRRHELRSLPVVDRYGRLQGAISIEDMVHVAEEEATRDMFKMFGLGGEDRAYGSLVTSLRSRLPWLFVNLGTVLMAGLMLSLFASTLGRMTLLAVFLPVVMGQAGITGTQTLTLIVRSLALGDVSTSDTRRLLKREVILAVAQGATVGVLLGVIVWAWQHSLLLAFVVAGAMVFNLLVAAAGGVLVPLGMKAARIDPASSSVVLVTTLTDVAGIVLYLGLATLLLTALGGG